MEPSEIEKLMGQSPVMPPSNETVSLLRAGLRCELQPGGAEILKAGFYVYTGVDGGLVLHPAAKEWLQERYPAEMDAAFARYATKVPDLNIAKKRHQEAVETAQAWLERGFIAVSDGIYRTTPLGWEKSGNMVRALVGEVLAYNRDMIMLATPADLDGVPVGEEEQAEKNKINLDDVKRSRKRLLSNLTPDELIALGVTPARTLNKREAAIKNRIFAVLGRAGAVN